MSDTPNTGETVTTATPSTTVSTPAPQAPVKTEDNQVEDIRKQLEEERKAREQAQMRANQLENEKKARDEAEAKKRDEELEENNQFKTLYEQERTKREAAEAEKEAEVRAEAISKVKADLLSEYSDEVKSLAEEVGLTLTSDDEAEVAAFKEKIEKINQRVANTSKVAPNNQARPSSNPDLNPEQLRETLQTEQGFHDYVTKKFPGIASMTDQR